MYLRLYVGLESLMGCNTKVTKINVIWRTLIARNNGCNFVNLIVTFTEKAVQRAERKLQIEYDKQMELKRKAADERFKVCTDYCSVFKFIQGITNLLCFTSYCE